VDRLKIGEPVEEQNAVGQRIGVLHFVDRFVALVIGELLHAPIIEHAVMQPILVDRGQLVRERRVEIFDYPGVALHGLAPMAVLEPFWGHRADKGKRMLAVWHQEMAEICAFANA
jgi:hypothetical protein